MKHLSTYKVFENLPHVEERNDRFKYDILPQIENYCSKYLTEYVSIRDSFYDKIINETDILYRGYKRVYRNDNLVRLKRRKDRKPMDTDINLHNAVGELSEEMFGWNMRTEGVFSIANKVEAGIYGESYIFLPIGDYEYLFNENIGDLTRYLSMGYVKSTIDLDSLQSMSMESVDRLFIDDYKIQLSNVISRYKDSDLQKAIVGNVEVSFNCNEYFILNISYLDLFIDYLNSL